MAPRIRIIAFGSAAALVLLGVVCAAVMDGLTGQILAGALITVGLGAVILLIFLEVGFSEDREQERDEERRRRSRQPPARSSRRSPRSAPPRRRR